MSAKNMRDLLAHSNSSRPVKFKQRDKVKVISALEEWAGIEFSHLSISIESSSADSGQQSTEIILPIEYSPDALLSRMLSTLG